MLVLTDSMDREKKLDILKMIDLSGARIIANESFGLSAQMYKEDDPELYEFLVKNINVNDFIEEIFVDLYAKYFTHPEIKELIKFYESPVGKKYINVSPQLMREATLKAEEYMKKKLEEFMD